NNDQYDSTIDVSKPDIVITLTNGANGEVQTATTDSNGKYGFENLLAGPYCISVVSPDKYVFVNTSVDSVVDETGNYCFDLTANNPDIDIGLEPRFSVGEIAWLDINNDGIRGSNEDLPEVKLSLTDGEGNPIAETTSDADGKYNFSDLPPGDYCVVATTPIETIPVTGSADSIFVDGKYCFTFSGPLPIDRTDVNPGFVKVLDIGQYVWVDKNNNGQQDDDEPLLGGVQVHVFSPNGTDIATLVTDTDGKYAVKDVVPGDYCVEMTIPDHYKQVATSSDSPFDSDTKYCFTITDQSILDANLGLVPLYDIGDEVWLDPFNTGKRDNNSVGVPDVELTLTDKDGNPIATTTTDSNGKYTFPNVAPGDYCVIATIPSGYKAVNTSDESPFTSESSTESKHCFTVTGPNDKVDLGLIPYLSLGDTVWIDANNDDKYESSVDVPKSDVVITLTNSATGEVKTATTDANGKYEISDLLAGPYCISVVSPDKYVFVNTSSDSVVDETGNYCFDLTVNNPNIDIGLEPRFSVGEIAWLDKDNDGERDDDEGLADVKLTLTDSQSNPILETTTDADGKYNFSDLPPGDYCVEAETPFDTTPVSNSPDSPFVDGKYCFTLTGPVPLEKTDVNPGFVKVLDIGQYVWIDKNNDGVQQDDEPLLTGVEVHVFSPNGTTVATLVTDENGHYLVNDVVPGDYCVQMTVPENYHIVPTSTDSPFDANAKYCFKVTDKSVLNANLGLIPLLTVGDFVWYDKNYDSTQRPDTVGVGGTSLTIFDKNGQEIESTVSDDNGNYQFTGLEPGSYCVRATIPSTGFFTNTSSDSPFVSLSAPGGEENSTAEYCFDLMESRTDVDVGVVLYLQIGAFTWIDINNDGLLSSNDLGIQNISIILTNNDNSQEVNTKSDEFASYIIENLVPGNYCIQFDIPEGFTTTIPGPDSVTDENGKFCFDLTETRYNINLGLIPLFAIGQVSWLDKNNDGVRQETEFLPGVNLSVTRDGAPYTTVVTDEQGKYYIDKLKFGQYCITATTPAGTVPVTGSVDSPFVNGVSCVTFQSADYPHADLTHNPGFVKVLDIGEYVWVDKNNNGQQDDDEPLLAGVQVHVFSPNGTTIANLVTDADGKYNVKDVVPGDYCVSMTIPAHYKQVATSPDSPFDSDTKYCFTITDESILDANLGLVPLYTIGDDVWLDPFNSGKRTPDSPGVSNVTLTLVDKDNNTIAVTTTDNKGVYKFPDVAPGNYCIIADIPTGYKAVNTSDDSPFTSESSTKSIKCFTIDGPRTDLDLGLTPYLSLGTISWIDTQNNGIRESTEPGKSGVKLDLVYPGSTVPIATVETNANGIYNIPQLLAGNYCLIATIPEHYKAVATSSYSPFSSLSSTSAEYCFTLLSNKNDANIGLVPLYNIGKNIWEDINGNGLKDSDEIDLADIKVEVLNPGFQPDTTDANGDYQISDLPPGDYCAKVTIPQGYIMAPTTSQSVFNISGIYCFTITFNPDDFDIDNINGGLIPPFISIGDFIFNDVNANGLYESGTESPVSNLTLQLLQNGQVIATTTTNSAGIYHFNKLAPGDYVVHLVLDKKYQPSPLSSQSHADANADIHFTLSIASASVATQQDNVPTYYINRNIDAGITLRKLSVGFIVFKDTNQDGEMEPTELGLESIPLTLSQAGIDISTVSTDVNGTYIFTDLLPGSYCVSYEIPENYRSSYYDPDSFNRDDGSLQYCFNLNVDSSEVGQHTIPGHTENLYQNAHVNFGIRPVLYSFGILVFADKSGNGVLESGENPLEGIKLELYDTNFNYINSTLTNVDGIYAFDGLEAGIYYGKVVIPFGTQVTKIGPDNVANTTGWFMVNLDERYNTNLFDATGFNLYADFIDPTHNVGLVPPTIAIGRFAYIDLNNNGKRDVGEPPLVNASVVITEGASVKAVTTTNAEGKYLVDNLMVDSICVTIVPDSSYILAVNGPDNHIGSNGSMCKTFDLFDVEGDENKVTPDMNIKASYYDFNFNAGFVPRTLIIGDQLFYDNNNNSFFEPAQGEFAASNLTVTLLKSDGTPATDNLGNIIPPQITGVNGKYLFTGVKNGNYTVKITIPFNSTLYPDGTTYSPLGGDSYANPDGTITVNYANYVAAPDAGVNTYRNLMNDAGLVVPCYFIGQQTWSDGNLNGKYDINEVGFPGVNITLYKETGQIAVDIFGQQIAPVTSTVNGRYTIRNVPAGRYYAVVTPPDRYTLAPYTTSSASGIFSFFDPNTFRSPMFSVPNAAVENQSSASNSRCKQAYNQVNAGIVTPFIAIGDRTYVDNNRNGLFDSGDAPLANVVVNLLTPNSQPVLGNNGLPMKATSDANGYYFIDNVRLGQYILSYAPPAGFSATTAKPLSTINNDANKANTNAKTDSFNILLTDPYLRQRTANETSYFTAPYINPIMDAGFYVSSVGIYGNIWNDLLSDGLYENNPPVNVSTFTVSLKNQAGVIIQNYTVLSNGTYKFDNLNTTKYSLVLNIPATTNWLATKPYASGSQTDSQIDSTFKTALVNLDPSNTNLTQCPFSIYSCLQVNMGIVRPSNKVVSGKIFKDYNCNGNMDVTNNLGTAVDTPLANVIVSLFYNGSLTPLATTTTNATGYYTFSGLVQDGVYLVTASQSSVTMTTGPGDRVESCRPLDATVPSDLAALPLNGLDFSFITNEEVCNDNPTIVTTCFVIGNYNGSTVTKINNTNEPVIVGFPYNAASHSQVVPIARYKNVGTTLGLGFDRVKRELYTSPFMKVGTDYGPGRVGTIYKINSNGTISNYVNVNNLFGPDYAGADDMQVAVDLYDYRLDHVYRVGFGDMDINHNLRKLAVVNLKQLELMVFPLDATPTAANTDRIPIPNECASKDPYFWQPFAVTYHLGKYYVGSVCNGPDIKDLSGYIHAIDASTKAVSKVLDVPFNYSRGCRNIDAQGICPSAKWSVWYDQDDIPQPLLASITFDGIDMILGIRDREGDLSDYLAAPDILRACFVGGKFVLEKDGKCGALSGAHLGPSGAKGQIEGPGIGEFYNDNFKKGSIGHDDTGGMAVTQVPGFTDVVSASFDYTQVYEGAVKFYNNKNGSVRTGFSLYVTNVSIIDNPVTFGKAGGLGDVQALCSPKTLQFGDRIFIDLDNDGIFDPIEPGKAGVLVSVFNSAGVLISTTTTDANGLYLFKNIPNNDSYTIVADGVTPSIVPSPAPTNLPFNRATMVNGKATITFSVVDGMASSNRFDLDFGIKK
ncbi:hypothetical protein CYY_009125, partial [Polysphondylium violaceum]